jgi:phthiodiolone/phenolphthiodiolone dimycocerosates ketoreductase
LVAGSSAARPTSEVGEFTFIGKPTEIDDRVSGYADNGLEHVILGGPS